MESLVNREARSKYEFLEQWDAGMLLSGAEVKSIKKGLMQLKGSYVSIDNGEIWLKNAYIAPYQKKNQSGYDPEHPRKLLLRKKEIIIIQGKLEQKGLTLVPIKVYSKTGLIKITIALSRGLKKHDKRERIKKRDIDRDMRQKMKEYY